jgi:hypothetical protein
MARHVNKVFPLRAEINVMKTVPRSSRVADAPLVYVLVRMDLHLGGRANKLRDLYLEAEIQVNPDKTVEVVWIEPQYEIVRGQQTPTLLGLYETILETSVAGDLSLIGVQ